MADHLTALLIAPFSPNPSISRLDCACILFRASGSTGPHGVSKVGAHLSQLQFIVGKTYGQIFVRIDGGCSPFWFANRAYNRSCHARRLAGSQHTDDGNPHPKRFKRGYSTSEWKCVQRYVDGVVSSQMNVARCRAKEFQPILLNAIHCRTVSLSVFGSNCLRRKRL